MEGGIAREGTGEGKIWAAWIVTRDFSSKADRSQLNLPYGSRQLKSGKQKN